MELAGNPLATEAPVHRNAPLTPEGRLRLCQRIEAGWPVAHAAASMGISRDRAYVWWRRYQAEGLAGLEDRSSRPSSFAEPDKAVAERRIVWLRRSRSLPPGSDRRDCWGAGLHGASGPGPARINRLDHLDRVTRAPIRRIEMSRPGELVHVDIKKLGRIPKGGGWRVNGRASGARPLAPNESRLRLRAHRHRWLQPIGLHRSPQR